MKLLMFQARRFEFSLELAERAPVAGTLEAVTVVFVHAEALDVSRATALLPKAARNIKWLSNKRGLRNIALHSFAHLSESKAPVEFGAAFIEQLASRLGNAGYHVVTTPYGHSCAWDLSVFAEPIAKVFKSL